MTSYSCSATPVSYEGDEISRVSRVVSRSDSGQTETGRLTDRRQTTDAATETEGSHTVSVRHIPA